MQRGIFPKPTIHLLVYRGLDRGAAIEFATNLMGPPDDTRHVINGGNLFLFEQRHKLVLLAWVGACPASANNCGGQHHRDANQSVSSLRSAARTCLHEPKCTTGRDGTPPASGLELR